MTAKKGRSKINDPAYCGAYRTPACAWLDQRQSKAEGEDPWKEGFVQVINDPHAQGITECPDNPAEEGSLWCRHCLRAIPTFNVEAHLESKKHMAHLEAARNSQDLRARALNNELPDWMEVREEAEFCHLCSAFVTDGHLASEKHRKRLEWHAASERICSDSVFAPPSLAAAQSSAGCELPAQWGDTRLFEFYPKDGWWRCRLCQCWADDSHVAGQKHMKRSRWPEHYIEGFEQTSDTHGPTQPADTAFLPSSALARKDDLPRGWRVAWSEDEHREYFYSEFTGQVCWHRPAPVTW